MCGMIIILLRFKLMHVSFLLLFSYSCPLKLWVEEVYHVYVNLTILIYVRLAVNERLLSV